MPPPPHPLSTHFSQVNMAEFQYEGEFTIASFKENACTAGYVLSYLGLHNNQVTKRLKSCEYNFYSFVNLKIIFQNTRRIKSYFPYKDRLSIYKAGCWNCDEFYISKTKRELSSLCANKSSGLKDIHSRILKVVRTFWQLHLPTSLIYQSILVKYQGHGKQLLSLRFTRVDHIVIQTILDRFLSFQLL